MGFQCTIASVPAVDSSEVVSYLEQHKFADVDSIYEEVSAPEESESEIEG